MIKDAEFSCHKMRQDIMERKELEEKYPNNFKVVKYEDLAMKTLQTAQSIYHFLNSSIPPEVTSWFNKSTNDVYLSVQDTMGTSRINSSSTAARWRARLSHKIAMAIVSTCRFVIDELGYTL